MLWLWYIRGENSLYAQLQVLVEFQRKMDQKDALGKLTTCLRTVVPVDRSATIVDFEECLREIGIK